MRRDLIAWAGHDLRTPLASVRAIVEALADGVVEDPETVQRYLRTAQRDILSLSALIDDLFELSQLDAGGLQLAQQPNSLADLVSDTIESFSTLAAQRQVTLTGEVAASVDPVMLDGGKIGRVLANLVGNALRHTPPSGAVRVEVSRPGDEVLVRVSDTGEGIPAADLPHIFERFYRGDKSRNRATGGAGLGLAIAKGIVEAHGGRIWAESTMGAGACFAFVLPDRRAEGCRGFEVPLNKRAFYPTATAASLARTAARAGRLRYHSQAVWVRVLSTRAARPTYRPMTIPHATPAIRISAEVAR